MRKTKPASFNMSTHIANFNEGVANYCVQCILTPLCSWLATNKNCSVNVDELMAALNVPAAARQAIPTSSPSTGFFPPAASATTTTTTRTKKSTAPHEGPTCQYKFVRGTKKDQLCGDPCVPNFNFCKSCMKKKAGGGGATVPSANAGFTPASAPAPATKKTTEELKVVAIKDRPGYYRTITEGYIVQQHPSGSIIATGIEVDGVLRPLTDTEKAHASGMGITVPETDPVPAPSSAPITAPIAPLPKVGSMVGVPHPIHVPVPQNK